MLLVETAKRAHCSAAASGQHGFMRRTDAHKRPVSDIKAELRITSRCSVKSIIGHQMGWRLKQTWR